MTEKEGKDLVVYHSRVVQRNVDRDIDLMNARKAVTEDIIESGTEVHNYAGAKIVEAAHFGHMLLQGASQTLNGTYEALEEDYCRQSAAYREFVFQCTGRYMASCLRQADSMPLVPERGVIAQIGDGIANVRDEWDRAKDG